jgi:hypothetical protein
MKRLAYLVLALPVVLTRADDFVGEDDAEEGEALMSVDMQRACPLIKLDASKDIIKKTPLIWGQYTLQFDTFNDKPLFKIHSQLCGRDVIVKGGRMQPSSTKHKVDCKIPVGTAPFYIYFAAQQKMWHLAATVGADKPLLMVPAETLSPDAATADWKFLKNKKYVSEPAIHATCNMETTNHGKTTNLKNMTLSTSGTCLGWRKTGGCDPDGTREKEEDQDCSATIESKLSGFCECADGARKKFACGHDVITCKSACALQYPMVVAQSGERVWTNQVASNLLKPTGEWLTSNANSQWVVFDLGSEQMIAAVKFSLWGSNANPHSVELQTSASHLGPWKAAQKFTIPHQAKSFNKQLHTSSRFWRLYIASNWGAVWGVGLARVEFVQAKRSKGLLGALASDPCELFTTQAGCIYDSSSGGGTNSMAVTRVAEDRAYCGWCSADKQNQKCTSGNPHKPKSVQCTGSWEWNTETSAKAALTATDSSLVCAAQTNCSSCSLQLECGWCISTQSCRSSGCKTWSTRHCSNFDAVKKVTLQRK